VSSDKYLGAFHWISCFSRTLRKAVFALFMRVFSGLYRTFFACPIMALAPALTLEIFNPRGTSFSPDRPLAPQWKEAICHPNRTATSSGEDDFFSQTPLKRAPCVSPRRPYNPFVSRFDGKF
jgi:hypothetical protein